MSHALRIRMAVPAAPEDARDRIAAVKGGYQTVLGPATDDPDDQETAWEQSTAPDGTDHYYALLRFDEREDRQAIVDELTDNQFPSVQWLQIESHSCHHEYLFAEYRDDPDYPDGSHQGCDGWTVERSRGNVPGVFE